MCRLDLKTSKDVIFGIRLSQSVPIIGSEPVFPRYIKAQAGYSGKPPAHDRLAASIAVEFTSFIKRSIKCKLRRLKIHAPDKFARFLRTVLTVHPAVFPFH